MSVQNKPDYKIFASGAKPGEVVPFPDILRGWGTTLDTTGGIPPLEFFNSSSMRLNEWLMYLTQRGIPEWDSAVDYPKSSLTQRNGGIYIAKSENKGSKPESSQQIWDPLYKFLGVDLKLDKSSVIGTVGQSETSVMSQKAATNAFQPIGNYQTAGNYADKSATVKQRFSDAIQCKYGMEIVDADEKVAIGLYSGKGKRTLTNGSAVIEIPAESGMMALNEKLLGIGQTLTNVMQYRAPGVVYRNDTGRPITVAVSAVIASTSGLSASTLYVGGIAHSSFAVSQSGFPVRSNVFAIIPPNSTYQLDNSAGISVLTWTELR